LAGCKNYLIFTTRPFVMKKTLYTAIVFLIVAISACDEAPNAHSVYTIKGYATYGKAAIQQTPIRIEGAIIAEVTTSLHEGFFEFKDVPPGTYTLKIQVGSSEGRFSRVVRTITVSNADLDLDHIILPNIHFFYPASVTKDGDGLSNHIKLSWQYGYPTDGFESYELRRYPSAAISETTGELIFSTNSVSDTTYSATIPANEQSNFAVFVRGTDFLACSGVESPFRYDLYLYDKFDSKPLEGINIALKINDPFGAIESRLGKTDANGNFFLTSIGGATHYSIFTWGTKSPYIVGPSYSDPFSEAVYAKTKETKAYLTTYSPLKLQATKTNFYNDTDSLFVEVGTYKKKYKCNNVPAEILNDWGTKLLSHQNHSIKWRVKTANGSTEFEHTIFCEAMTSYSYTISF
jgi:hypothetical protein